MPSSEIESISREVECSIAQGMRRLLSPLFPKVRYISSCGTEDNIKSLIMERDNKDFINGLSEEIFVTSDPVCSI